MFDEHYDQANEGFKLDSTLVGFEETDIRGRPFRLLRTVLSRRLKDTDARVIGVTSASPNVGKSFVASNLAAAMSQLSSIRTVLLDLDLQRPTLADLFGIHGGAGVGEYLAGEEHDIMKCTREILDTGLIVAPTFERVTRSAELLASARFGELITQLKGVDYRPWLICDLPPLFVSDDAMLATEQLDGVILIVEEGVTTRKQLESCLQLLSPVPVFGTILNRCSEGILAPYGYDGGYGGYGAY
ncbi:MAG: CpsD/CapB family tyrosine-protein kinase [Pseudomonadota bacterium]